MSSHGDDARKEASSIWLSGLIGKVVRKKRYLHNILKVESLIKKQQKIKNNDLSKIVLATVACVGNALESSTLAGLCNNFELPIADYTQDT